MILRANNIGPHEHPRFLIQNLHDGFVWTGIGFHCDWTHARLYAHPSDAGADMQEILKDFYGQLPMHRYVVPVEIEVFGNVSQKDIARYLYRASVLSIRTPEFGNGPGEALVLPVIHWGFIKELKHSVLDPDNKPDNPAAEWGLEDENEDE